MNRATASAHLTVEDVLNRSTLRGTLIYRAEHGDQAAAALVAEQRRHVDRVRSPRQRHLRPPRQASPDMTPTPTPTPARIGAPTCPGSSHSNRAAPSDWSPTVTDAPHCGRRCHKDKTQREAAAARAALHAQARQHPGLA